MDAQKQSNSGNSNEMDLGSLFIKIGDFFAAIFRGFIHAIASLRRTTIENRILIFCIVTIFLLGGIYYAVSLKKKFYESTMILSSIHLNKRIVDNSIQKLNKLASDPDKTGLKTAMGVNDATASNLILFKSKPFIEEKEVVDLQVLKEQLKNSKLELENPKVIDEVIKRLEIENQHAFEITVRLYNPQEFLLLEKAIVNFFKSNEYVKKRLTVNRANLLSLKEKLNKDSEKLDSLKIALYDNFRSMADGKKSGSNNVILGQEVTSPLDIYNLDLALYQQKLVTERDIFLESDFEVVDGFTQMNVPASAPTSTVILQAMLIGLGVSYLFLGIRQFNQYLSKIA